MAVELATKNYQLRELKTAIKVDFPLQLEPCIRDLIEREGFTSYKIDKRCVSTDGGNYLGVLYEIDIKGRTYIGEKELYLFVKHVIENSSLKIISMSDLYNTEIFAYKELSKIFGQLQEKANVPLEEQYKMIHAYEESNIDALIMDNIGKRGYTTYYRMEVAYLEFYEIAVKQLARFHGLSLVLKETALEYFRDKIKTIKCPFIFNDGWTDMVTGLKNATMNYVYEEYKDKLEKSFDSLLYKYGEYYTDDNLKVCLRHGDYRPCNIMIKLNEGEIEDLIPVDYQLLHFGNPVFDFLYLIFGGTDRQFRNSNLLNLKELYYETLDSFLKYFDLDVKTIYPREDFEKVYKEKLDFGLMTAVMLLPFVFASENDVPDFSQSELRFNIDVKIKDRLHGVLDDFTEWGFL